LLTEYLGAGYIDYETYLELLPAQIAVFKTTLLKKVKEGNVAQLKQAQEQIMVLQEQLQQSNAAVQQLAQRIEAQGKTVEQVDRLISKNRALSKTLAELYQEATTKINTANAAIMAQAQENANVRSDAKQMALMMAEDDARANAEAEESAAALEALIGQ
jgi:CII-binding regulator of phage lambda lysogenization HflD